MGGNMGGFSHMGGGGMPRGFKMSGNMGGMNGGSMDPNDILKMFFGMGGMGGMGGMRGGKSGNTQFFTS